MLDTYCHVMAFFKYLKCEKSLDYLILKASPLSERSGYSLGPV